MSQGTKTERAITAHNDYKSIQSEGTAREYTRHVRRFKDFLAGNLENVPNQGVTVFDCHSGHVEDYYQWMLEDEYAPESIRTAHSGLISFYDALKDFSEEGIRGFPKVSVGQNPTEHASPERLDGMHDSSKANVEGGDRPLDKQEVRKLVEHVPADKPVRNELMVRLLYQTGVRRSELVRIKLKHIDYERREITVYGKKTDDPRTVWYQPICSSLVAVKDELTPFNLFT